MESYLDLRQSGSVLPGYGWIFPLGDGTVNVGVGVISSFHRWKEVNTSTLLEVLVSSADPSWGLSAAGAIGEPTGGMLPMSFSVGPRAGANWVLVGDATGAVNPFNGEGIEPSLVSGRIAADVLHEALTTGNSTTRTSNSAIISSMASRSAATFTLPGGREAVRCLATILLSALCAAPGPSGFQSSGKAAGDSSRKVIT